MTLVVIVLKRNNREDEDTRATSIFACTGICKKLKNRQVSNLQCEVELKCFN